MDSIISLCTLPFLDNSYQNVLDFGSLSSQYSYFNQQTKKQINGNVANDSEREQITLNAPLTEIRNYDYLFLTGEDNKRYFYFITNKTYKTSSACVVDVELDVYSTYLFDHSLSDSFVERTHINRWNGDEINKDNISVDEGFPTYDYQATRRIKNAYNLLENGTNIFITSTPLSKVGTGGENNGGIYPDFDPTQTPISLKCVASNGDIYTYPTTGYITAGPPSYPADGKPTGSSTAHYGIDIGAPSGEADSTLRAVYSPYIGTFVSKGENAGGWGNYVDVNIEDHGKGETYHRFAHLYKFSDIEIGEKVTKSTVIGYMGNTGNSTGKHLHCEISKDGTFNTSNYITPDVDWESKWRSEVK